MNKGDARDEVLFSTALALPLAERDYYLDRACASADLQARVKALLSASDLSDTLIRHEPSQQALDAERVEVANYRVLEDLGEGGWGTVYRAEQMAPLRREVALKIIKLGMDTKAVILRFEAERQALAMMDHPNIAKVFDAGATAAGRPYFAMEIVRGVKITQYCDSVGASVAERLSLFVQVCQAIQHAHRKGTIHRDIKPSNVMVTLCDGEAVVKVIDFGVAKAIQSGPPENTLLTVFGAFVGTPAYVSPEQMDYGARIDARSDIYSLGVLLHELLCGRTPFAAGELSPSGLNLLRVRVRSEEPLLPSKLLRRLPADAASRVADSCRTTRSKLIGHLQGDLDWIIIRCLEKDPDKRYQSVRDLSADVQRFLRDEPVVARPRRLFYSFRKFAKRHRMVFVTGAAVIVLLSITSVLTSWMAVRATRANRLAQSVTNFLQSVVLVQDGFRYRDDNDVRLLTVLDGAAVKVGTSFSAEPTVEASVRIMLGTAYDSLGANPRAETQFREALATYETQFGPRDRHTLGTMVKLVGSLAKQARYGDAERLGRRALRHCRQVLGESDVETLSLLTTMAIVWFEGGKVAESRRQLPHILDLQQAALGPEHPTTLQSKLVLAAIHLEDGDFHGAEKQARFVFDARRRTLGSWHPETRVAAEALQAIHTRSGKCGFVEELSFLEQERRLEEVVVAARSGRYELRGLRPEPWPERCLSARAPSKNSEGR